MNLIKLPARNRCKIDKFQQGFDSSPHGNLINNRARMDQQLADFWMTLGTENLLKQALSNNRGGKKQLGVTFYFVSTLGMCSYCQSGITYQWKPEEMGWKRACVCNIAIICHEADIQQRVASMSPWIWLQQLYLSCISSCHLWFGIFTDGLPGDVPG